MSGDVELRGMVSRELVDVIDAIAIARKQTRIDVVTEVLNQFVEARIHEAMLIQRVARSNPRLTDSVRSHAE